MRPGWVRFAAVAVAGVLGASTRAEATELIQSVSISPAFFNPALGQTAAVSVRLAAPGSVTLSILDRDNYVIRTLPSVSLPAGESSLTWDGKDQGGAVVPNEAYCINIKAEAGGSTSEYAPSRDFRRVLSDPKRSYSMVSGVLKYELAGPSRMHIQAGEAVLVDDPKEGKRDGPVLKTIVDREPRTGGTVVETWDGYDESRTIHIPSLKNFAISVLAESLPPATVVTVGSRNEGFREYASRSRLGKAPLYPFAAHPERMPGMKHDNLTALDDFSPELSVEVAGKKDEQGRIEVGARPLALTVRMPAGQDRLFVRPEAALDVFVDEKRVLRKAGARNPSSLSIPPEEIPPGEHRVTVNWISTHGPMSAQVVRVVRKEPAKEAAK